MWSHHLVTCHTCFQYWSQAILVYYSYCSGYTWLSHSCTVNREVNWTNTLCMNTLKMIDMASLLVIILQYIANYNFNIKYYPWTQYTVHLIRNIFAKQLKVLWNWDVIRNMNYSIAGKCGGTKFGKFSDSQKVISVVGFSLANCWFAIHSCYTVTHQIKAIQT